MEMEGMLSKISEMPVDIYLAYIAYTPSYSALLTCRRSLICLTFDALEGISIRTGDI